MSSRDAILSKIRNKQTGNSDPIKRRGVAINRIQNAPQGIIPKRGQLKHAAQIKLFCKQAKAVQTTVKRVSGYGDVPEAIADYLRKHNLPAAFRMGDDERLAETPWDKTPAIEISKGKSDGEDLVGVSHAFAGIAETGTLMLISGAENPTTINFLPETHIVVINENDIAGDYEAAFANVRDRFGKGTMPRTVNMVTGPSRSGDIEQTILLGAHGPRNLHVVVVGQD